LIRSQHKKVARDCARDIPSTSTSLFKVLSFDPGMLKVLALFSVVVAAVSAAPSINAPELPYFEVPGFNTVNFNIGIKKQNKNFNMYTKSWLAFPVFFLFKLYFLIIKIVQTRCKILKNTCEISCRANKKCYLLMNLKENPFPSSGE
jgi:hypothetical protein